MTVVFNGVRVTGCRDLVGVKPNCSIPIMFQKNLARSVADIFVCISSMQLCKAQDVKNKVEGFYKKVKDEAVEERTGWW